MKGTWKAKKKTGEKEGNEAFVNNQGKQKLVAERSFVPVCPDGPGGEPYCIKSQRLIETGTVIEPN